jgi:ABC-2 type transport system permease protein
MKGYLVQLFAVADAELRKLRHDPWELASRAIQPVHWLLLFGNVMARVRGLTPQSVP